jgi:phosphoglycerol transferase MdoB-like AlkP superfamily enzyme
LPAYLSNSGYNTIASHPNFAAFWNRVNAYKRLGFADYWSKADFNLDDMNGPFLSDQSLYQQIWAKQQAMRESKKPLFNYIVTYFGHLDYPLNKARPSVIKLADKPSTIERYVNTVYYKTKELMDFYETIRKEDPDALIVMFGDHLPNLGANYSGYVESGLMNASKADFDAPMFLNYSKTPLIVVNGKKGVQTYHELPMFKVPELITGLLGDKQTSLANVVTNLKGLRLRPLSGITLVKGSETKDAKAFTCVDGNDKEDCNSVNRWLEQVKVLTMDIFSGDQKALK